MYQNQNDVSNKKTYRNTSVENESKKQMSLYFWEEVFVLFDAILGLLRGPLVFLKSGIT